MFLLREYSLQLKVLSVALAYSSLGWSSQVSLTQKPSSLERQPLIVLVPGAASSGPYIYVKNTVSEKMKIRYFGGLERALQKEGLNFLVCPLISTQDQMSLEERANECASLINNYVTKATCRSDGLRNVLILGHSLGGLVARLVANLETVEPCISSVTTVSTPHRGTIMADFIINPTGFRQGSSGIFWNNFFVSIGMIPTERPYLYQLQMLREGKNQDYFAGQDTPENLRVSYYSFSTSQEKLNDSVLKLSQNIISEEMINVGLHKDARHQQQFEKYGTANDGVVPELSMTYGNDLGHIDSDHFESACSDLYEKSDGCLQLIKAIVPHLQQSYELLKIKSHPTKLRD